MFSPRRQVLSSVFCVSSFVCLCDTSGKRKARIYEPILSLDLNNEENEISKEF